MSEDNDFEYETRIINPISPSIFESKWRVKLYKLNYIGQWDDMGTGYVSIIKEVNKELNFITKFIPGRRLFHKNVCRN